MAIAVTLATPDALVTAVAFDRFPAVPFDRVALGPVVGAEKVTMAPLTACPAESFTVACSALGNTVPTVADCGMAPVAVILAGDADILSSEKVAGPAKIEDMLLAVTM